jgi:drug/metabolite transporter (DMT)-like permease
MGSIALALCAICIWSSLAVLGTRVSHLPALLTVGVALCVGGLAGAFRARDWKVPLGTFAIGVGGIFGYHFLLFSAFRTAPAVETNLLNYLWPLLIVLLSPLYLPGLKLTLRHAAGASLGLAGAFIVVGGGRLEPDLSHLGGYLLAASAAFVWASYSLLTKRVRPFSTGAVGGFCLASGLLSLIAFAVERAASPTPEPIAIGGGDWLCLLLLGLGPMGGAFFAWDAALKRGDPRAIGSLAYLTPLLSTLNLVLLGGKAFSATAAGAMALIVAGAALGTFEPGWLRRKRTNNR